MRSVASDAAAPVASVAARTLCRHDVNIVIVVIVCERLHLLAVLHKEFTSNWLVEARGLLLHHPPKRRLLTLAAW